MDVHLFIPCYLDQVHPEVAMATVTVLRRAGCTVHYNAQQTCCGQPMANTGCASDAAILGRRHLDLFAGKTTVCPSGSCTSMVRHHYHDLGMSLSKGDEQTMEHTYELAEFLVEVLGVTDLKATFPHRVSLHQSCHGLRELGLGNMSERRDAPKVGAAEALLSKVQGLTLLMPERRDECCGFGGTFAVAEADLSSRMGHDRCDQLAQGDAEYMTGNDQSCLMHLDGLRKRRGRGPKAIHLAEILACQ
jgi:L-lactate dehydrogenase complex protein LldE